MDLTAAIKEAVRDVVREEVRAALKDSLVRPPQPPRETTRLLTTSEAAEFAKVGAATVRRWIGSEDLPALRTKHGYRIDRNDLDAFLRRAPDGDGLRFDANAAAEAALRHAGRRIRQ